MLVNDNDASLTARVTSSFSGVPDGEVYPIKFAVGAIIRGSLARSEVESGRAEWLNPPKIENKAHDSPFPTGPVELSSSRRPGQAKTPKTSRKRVEKRSF
ncbi:hypothetical protein [Hoeflea sp.]|uniref:hypothetical protein n=1 Tax=Hoeflea sp. TaxID=1940281 RepID=UPI0019B6EBBA|nr:hypothetical protein [Hoeflea sp.]MBC7282565.1 hypothetical protein [Hoeflea sp.]